MNIFQRLKLDLELKWIIFLSKHELTKSAKIRRKYCANGWHKLVRISYQHSTFIKGKEKVLFKTEYLKCKYCEYKFFATLKDRNKYNAFAEKESIERSAIFKKLLDSSAEKVKLGRESKK